ncbi:MAG: trehalose-phosphatase [Phycisphaeraceae bacterium]|nr:trehalose-phosphatase [Phycisphaeraceae bacterium]
MNPGERQPAIDPALEERLRTAAAAPMLLIACDFDGTLSPIAPTPSQASPDAEAVRALHELDDLARTHGAVISGRGVDEIERLIQDCRGLLLVGSHGAEAPLLGPAPAIDRSLLTEIEREVRSIASELAGSLVEVKPYGVALHYRLATGDPGPVLDAVSVGPGGRPGVQVIRGHKVIELCVATPGKGRALERLKFHTDAKSVVFIGDDETDEHAFAALAPSDVGIKVGSGPTVAALRVAQQADVAVVLRRLGELRRAWLTHAAPTPINAHAMLSDQRTVALINPRGGVAWLCAPRIDSGAVFASLLGGPGRGEWSVEPEGDPAGPARQTYAPDSMILTTHLGGVKITDYLDCSAGRAYQRAGRSDLVRVIEGVGTVRVRFVPRLDFGRQPSRLAVVSDGLVVEGAHEPLCLYAPGVAWTVEEDGRHHSATASINLERGPVLMEMRIGTSSLRASPIFETSRRAQTQRFWSGWAASLAIPDLPPDARTAVARSALVLKALCHGPSGAIAAAATTSLPAPIGGSRNWDYRYCWPRDSALAAASLLRLGNTGTAMKLLDWLVGVVDRCESSDRLRPIYTVAGAELGPEAELSELAGYAGSRPVRIGNAAAGQLQLDMFGPIVELVAMLTDSGAPITPQYWRLVESMVQAVARRWQEPDHGIWEVRSAPRHHVHSKAMCWLAVDRGIRVADAAVGRVPDGWIELRDRIAADVLTQGWNADAGAFSAAYGTPDLDAAALHLGLSGLLPPDDARFVATVQAIDRELGQGPVIRRYRSPDGLPGVEGGFLICTAWMIEALALIGRTEEAARRFARYLELAGPTGLLAEQFEPTEGVAAGNYPQAYSHLGLINAAVRLAASTRR